MILLDDALATALLAFRPDLVVCVDLPRLGSDAPIRFPWKSIVVVGPEPCLSNRNATGAEVPAPGSPPTKLRTTSLQRCAGR